MITKEDILRIYSRLDSQGLIPLDLKNIDAIEVKLNQELEQVESEINQRQIKEIPVSLAALFKTQEPTSKQQAFLETFAFPMSASMRAMVYFLTQENADIMGLDMHYTLKENFSLRVLLGLKDSPDQTCEFNSESIWDAEIIRHFALMQMNGQPIFAGYMPLSAYGS